MRAGMTEWSSQCRSGNVKISSSSCAPHQFHSEFVTRNWFRWQALQTKSGRRYPKITFYPVKANFLNNSRGGGWRGGGRKRARNRTNSKCHRPEDKRTRQGRIAVSFCTIRHDRVRERKEERARRKEESMRSHACITRQLLRWDCEVLRGAKLIRSYLLRVRPRKIYIYLKKLHLFILPSSVQDYPPFITADQREGGRSSCFLLTYLPRRIAMNITTCNKKNARGIITKRNVNREPRIRDLGTKRRERLIRRLF